VAALRAALAGTAPIPAPQHDAMPLPGDLARAAIEAAGRPDAERVPVDRAQQTTAPAIAPAHGLTEPASRPPLFAVTPMRSTPPGTPPPVSMPLPRELPVLAEPNPTAVVPGPTSVRRAPMLAGLVGAAALAATVLWQFVGVIDGERPVAPARAPASATPVAPVASVRSDPSSPPVASTPAESTAIEAVADAASGVRPDRQSGAGTVAPRPANRTRPVVVAGPSSARAACGAHSFIAFAICVDRECERARFRDSPDCVRILEDKRRRAER
jgi:hypothetical protein